jgi:hypothetical protein
MLCLPGHALNPRLKFLFLAMGHVSYEWA